jgi:hypothetical protein
MGLPGVTSLNHVMVVLPKLGAAIASMADGTRSKDELASRLALEIIAGRLPLPEPGQRGADSNAVLGLAKREIADTLRLLSESAVLAPRAP